MSTIAICSENQDFAEDLRIQTEKYVPEFKVCDIDEEILPDVVIIDDKVEVFAEIRALYKNIPLIFLASGKYEIVESGLNIVLKKPFSLMRFLDVLRSANNKLDNSEEGYLNLGAYELRPSDKEIENINNSEITKLTEKEVNILKYLYKFADAYISKNDLQKNVWKYNENVSTHTVETHIYRLRRKVEKNGAPQLILTDKGGYKLNTEK